MCSSCFTSVALQSEVLIQQHQQQQQQQAAAKSQQVQTKQQSSIGTRAAAAAAAAIWQQVEARGCAMLVAVEAHHAVSTHMSTFMYAHNVCC